MPIFEYKCRACTHLFETIVLSSREKISCPTCGSDAVEKQLSLISKPASAQDAPSSACACTPQTCGCH